MLIKTGPRVNGLPLLYLATNCLFPMAVGKSLQPPRVAHCRYAANRLNGSREASGQVRGQGRFWVTPWDRRASIWHHRSPEKVRGVHITEGP